MTAERRITLAIVTDDTGTKCAAECPHTEPVKGHWCDLFGPIHGQRRAIKCAESESAAREAEVDALRRGFALAKFRAEVDDVDGNIEWVPAIEALHAEIERIRRGES